MAHLYWIISQTKAHTMQTVFGIKKKKNPVTHMATAIRWYGIRDNCTATVPRKYCFHEIHTVKKVTDNRFYIPNITKKKVSKLSAAMCLLKQSNTTKIGFFFQFLHWCHAQKFWVNENGNRRVWWLISIIPANLAHLHSCSKCNG